MNKILEALLGQEQSKITTSSFIQALLSILAREEASEDMLQARWTSKTCLHYVRQVWMGISPSMTSLMRRTTSGTPRRGKLSLVGGQWEFHNPPGPEPLIQPKDRVSRKSNELDELKRENGILLESMDRIFKDKVGGWHCKEVKDQFPAECHEQEYWRIQYEQQQQKEKEKKGVPWTKATDMVSYWKHSTTNK